MQPDDALNDTALDRELRRALAVDPSPEFVPRVRMRVAIEPAPAGWRFSWLACCAAAGVAAVIIVAAIATRDRAPVAGAVPSIAKTATGGASIELPKAAGSTPTGETPRTVRTGPLEHGPRHSLQHAAVTSLNARARAREPGGSDADVLVDVRESNAIRQLILAIRDGRVPVVQPDLAVATEAAPLTQIVIPPLTIDPIGPQDGLQGVRP